MKFLCICLLFVSIPTYSQNMSNRDGSLNEDAVNYYGRKTPEEKENALAELKRKRKEQKKLKSPSYLDTCTVDITKEIITCGNRIFKYFAGTNESIETYKEPSPDNTSGTNTTQSVSKQ